MADEQEVVETGEQAVVDEQPAGEASETDKPVDPVEEAKRRMQADYTRKMQQLAKEREELKKEREAWEQAKQATTDKPVDLEVDFEALKDDPVYEPGKKLASQLKLTQTALADERTAKKAIEVRLARIEELALDREFDEQFATATKTYAANLTIDREVVRQHIRANGLDAKPKTMVKQAILDIAGDQFLAQAVQTPAVAAEKPKTLPKSAPKAAVKEAQLSPLQDALESAKRLFSK